MREGNQFNVMRTDEILKENKISQNYSPWSSVSFLIRKS